jgi:serine/threonine protein kinase
VPKVIDFGIAKATEGRLTDATVYTQLHQFIGTPAYMSPEQAEMSGLDIDTRSDIYSLGVLLYELLAGSTPFDAKGTDGLGHRRDAQDHPREGAGPPEHAWRRSRARS